MRRRFGPLALLLVLASGVAVLLPPRSRDLGAVPAALDAPVRGAMHIHTRRSDGGGTMDDVASAAARAGLRFVIVTDHSDASREPEPPAYRSGVLCIDAVEISTENGHLVAIGLPRAPYPLGGEARDVVEDVRRLGGFSLAAHPVSPKAAARWTEWTAPFDGLEWLNGDSEWRDEPRTQLLRAIATYPFRPPESLGLLLDRPDLALRRWDALTQRRRVVAVAGGDAHARFGLPEEDDPVRRRVALPVPGYEPVFRTFSIALAGVDLTGRAATDAGTAIDAIRRGHVYSVIDSIASPGAISFMATSGRFRASAGESLTTDGPVRLGVRLHAPPDAQIVLVKDGKRVLEKRGTWLQQIVEPVPGVYRVEVELPGAPGDPMMPWIVTNPIYVGWSDDRARVPARAAASQASPLEPMSTWSVEQSASAQGAVDIVPALGGRRQALFRFALSGTPSSGPYAALVVPVVPGLPQHDRLTFRARADHPMRLSVQLRVAGEGNGDRWHRSVFVDTTPREVSVFFNDMTPRRPTSAPHPPLAEVGAILFVIDSVNTRVGTSGQIAIENLRYEN